jgi:hypothetical protein
MLNYTNVKKFKNIHLNETCLIIGTGPSINQTDLSFVNKFKVFGVNGGYKLKNIKYDYFCVIDEVVWSNHKENIFKNIEKKTEIFITDNCKNKNKFNKNPVILKRLNFINEDSIINPEQGIWRTHTVTGMCMQLAYYMGFKNIILIGCDCHYSDDGNHHFDGSQVDNYLRTDWTEVFNFYEILKTKMKNTFVCNSTKKGYLEVFSRINFKTWKKYEDDIILNLYENSSICSNKT